MFNYITSVTGLSFIVIIFKLSWVFRTLTGKSLLLQKIKQTKQSSFKRKIPKDLAKPEQEMISGVDEAWHRRVNAPAKKQMSEPTHITAHVMSLLL